MMYVKEVSELVGISVRTLHYYDEIGLLSPAALGDGGYRLYDEENLNQLQQILLYKELGFGLQTIKQLIYAPAFDREQALLEQRRMLLQEKARFEQMIGTITQTIKHLRGEITMSKKEQFVGFQFDRNPYEAEAKERWGEKAVEESKAKLAAKTDEEQKEWGENMNDLYRRLAALRHLPATDQLVQQTIAEWYVMLNEMGSYSLEAFAALGQMYIADDRFKNNIDQFGEGLAQLMCDAMEEYARVHQGE